jgi:Amt family ammonium transporter
VHGIAGIVGAMFVVFFGSASAPAQTAGVFLGGDPGLIWREIVAITVTLVYSFTVTYAIAWVMNRIRPIRVSEDDETAGLDRALHAETAYARDTL